jgi:hypothetical protein
MSLSYCLDINSGIEIAQLSQLIAEKFTCTVQGDQLIYNKLWICILENESYDAEDVEEKFGFYPNLAIVFNFSFISASDFELEFSALYEVVLFILEKIPGDAILLYNGEIIDLQRIQGKLIFNQQQWTSLTSEVLSRLGRYCNSSDTTQKNLDANEPDDQILYSIEDIDSPFL